MIRQYFDGLVAGLEAQRAAAGDGFGARKRFALEVARWGARLYSGEEQVAWCGVLAPFDLLRALGVVSCFVEFVGAMLASTGGVEEALAGAEQAGWSTDLCGFHRAVGGAALAGLMPAPDLLIATTCPCSSGVATVEGLAARFGKPLFLLDIPVAADARGVRYLADRLRQVVDFVTETTGRPLDPDRLRETMARTNRARALLCEVYGLARAVPSPVRPRDLANFGFVMALLLGTETAIEVAAAYRDEYAAKVAAGAAGVEGERVRLLWVQSRIQFMSPLEKMLERMGAAIVVDELNDIFWAPIDPDDPYEGLALRAITNPLAGPVERRVASLVRLARDYRVDGVIHPCHWGCRQGTGARGMIEAGLREAGLPMLSLEVDCADPRNFSEGQLRTRLEAFVEMLDARKG